VTFRFRLEKILRLRHRKVEERGRQVREAAELLAACEERIAAARAEIAEIYATPAGRRDGAADLAWLRQRADWLTRLREVRDELEEAGQAAAVRVDQARARLLAAHRDEEILERLKQRQQEAWRQEQARRERKLLDEVAAVRAARSRGSPLPSRW